MNKPSPLELLAEKYKPSKMNHNYMPHYWRHFRDHQMSAKVVIEIGVCDGGSLRMWEEFFPNATIYGVDINPEVKAHEKGRIKIFIGDQGDEKFMKSIPQAIGQPIDILVDDGSHAPNHQIEGFRWLFDSIRHGGLYVIEDIGVSPGADRLVVNNELKGLVDNINYWPPGFPGEQWVWLTHFPKSASYLDKNVTGIAFYRYLTFITKGHNPEDNPFLNIRLKEIVGDSPSPVKI